jgi:hypothetical protein
MTTRCQSSRACPLLLLVPSSVTEVACAATDGQKQYQTISYIAIDSVLWKTLLKLNNVFVTFECSHGGNNEEYSVLVSDAV